MHLIKSDNRKTPEVIGYRPEIDGLRAIAVIAVIVNHFNKDILPNGFLGVDIFFVISGYLITASVAKRNADNPKEFLLGFFERRVKRILPALAFFVLICSILICLVNPEAHLTIKTGITSLFGLSNLYLIRYATDYFAPATNLKVFVHTWSLAVEEQFYFIFPFLILFTGFQKNKLKSSIKLFYLILLLSIVSFILFLYLNKTDPLSAYFLLPCRFWEISSGCLLFLLIKLKNNFKITLQKIPSFLVLFLIFVIMSQQKIGMVFGTISIVLLTTVLVGGIKTQSNTFKLLSNKLFVSIGLLSYSLYLWHWGILSLSRWTIGIHSWSIPFQIILILLFSIFSYKFIELPFRKNKWSLKKSLNIFIGLMISIISTAILLPFSNTKYQGFLYIGNKERLNNWGKKSLQRGEWAKATCSYSANANNPLPREENFKRCWYAWPDHKNKEDRISIYMIGDSYGQQILPLAEEIQLNRNDIKFNAFTMPGCLPSKNLIFSEKEFRSCNQITKDYINFFKNNSKKNDILLISFAFHFFAKDNVFIKTDNQNKPTFDIYIDELRSLSQSFYNKNKIFISNGPPSLNSSPKNCSEWFKSRGKEECRKDEPFEPNRTIDWINKLIKLDTSSGEIIYLNFDEEMKKIISKNREELYGYYYDEAHLSNKGALKLVDYVDDILNKHLD